MTATCKEAAIGIPGFYVPCGKPAVKIIGWKGRSEQPIPMCEACSDHNVRNRNGYIVAEVIKEDF